MLTSSEKTCKKYRCGILQCISKHCFTCLQRWDSVNKWAANVKTITWKHGDSKEYLTESEIKRLEKVKFDIFPEVKQASLFAIYTGLRRSDVLALDWRNLHLRSKRMHI